MAPFGKYGHCWILGGLLDHPHSPTLGPQNLGVRERAFGRFCNSVTLSTLRPTPPPSPVRAATPAKAKPHKWHPLHPQILPALTGCPSPACPTRLHVRSPANFESPAAGTPPLTTVTPGQDASGHAAGHSGLCSSSYRWPLHYLPFLQVPAAQLAFSNSPCCCPSFH